MILQRLRDMREDRDLTQAAVAEILHVRQNTYSQYELGVHAIPVEALCRLADFYGVSVDYLLGRTDVSKPYPRRKNRR